MSVARRRMDLSKADAATQARRIGWLLIPLLPMLIGGCGPTPEELLSYEMVLVVVGFIVGMVMWGIGCRIGHRIDGRWFVCSHCLHPQPARVSDGQT